MKKWRLCEIVPLIAGLVILAEGSFIYSFAGPAVIDGIGGILKSTVQLGGLQLWIIGVVTVTCSILLLYNIFNRYKTGLIRKVLRIVLVAAGLVVIVEGVVLAFMGGKTTITGYGTIEAYTVAAFAAQLFFLGVSITIPAMLGNVGWRTLLIYGSGAGIASAGLVVIGVAAPTIIEGIGGVLAQTVEIAGIQLLILGLAIVVLSLVMNLTNKLRMPLSIMRYIIVLLVAIEGLVLIAFATPIDIQGIGGITARTLILSGFGLTLIGLFTLFATGLRSQGIPLRLRRVTISSVLLLALMIPVAALTYGQVF